MGWCPCPIGDLRSTLVGGLTASVGSAVAFYFSAKSSEQARQDLLQASGTLETVPDLSGKTEADAAALLGRTSLKLVTSPADPAAGTVVPSQTPPPGSTCPSGSSITAVLGAPGS